MERLRSLPLPCCSCLLVALAGACAPPHAFAQDATASKLTGRQVVWPRVVGAERVPVKDISLAEYLKLEAEHKKHKRQTFKTTGSVRGIPNFGLVAFDETTAEVALLIQPERSKVWKCLARYRLKRNAKVDKALYIDRRIEERTRVIGGVRYGMSLEEVYGKKGQPDSRRPFQLEGSGGLVYPDVIVHYGRHEATGEPRVTWVAHPPTPERRPSSAVTEDGRGR